MFGALNRFIGRLDAGSDEHQNGVVGAGGAAGGNLHNAYGFQVLRSGNREVPLEPWFDFIIGINGRAIDNPNPHLFATEVRNCAGSTISLGVFSAKGRRIRELYVTVPKDPPSLGLALQWMPLSSVEDVWHILDVIPNSPADVAGLLPYGDYVIGSPEGLVRGESGLGELVEDYMNRPLRLLVYNHEYNVCRPVTITPSRSWGGEGALGCVLGFGALHRIPAPLDEPPNGPGETLFESSSSAHDAFADPASLPASGGGGGQFTPTPAAPASGSLHHQQGDNFLVPANITTLQSKSPPPPHPPPLGGGSSSAATATTTTAAAPARHGKKSRAHHYNAASPSSAMDEYFKEGEAKSLEQDYAPSSKAKDGALPPPPPPSSKGAAAAAAAAPPKGPLGGSASRSPAPVEGDDDDGDVD